MVPFKHALVTVLPYIKFCFQSELGFWETAHKLSEFHLVINLFTVEIPCSIFKTHMKSIFQNLIAWFPCLISASLSALNMSLFLPCVSSTQKDVCLKCHDMHGNCHVPNHYIQAKTETFDKIRTFTMKNYFFFTSHISSLGNEIGPVFLSVSNVTEWCQSDKRTLGQEDYACVRDVGGVWMLRHCHISCTRCFSFFAMYHHLRTTPSLSMKVN